MNTPRCGTIGHMYTIVGLGNPGEEYRMTRHNVGWQALAQFVQTAHLPEFVKSGTYNAMLSEGNVHGQSVGVILPMTFMNKSGSSVLKYTKERGVDTGNVIVVHDEIDLPFGSIRISVGKNGGGHNGVQSVIDSIGTSEFIRVRIGVAKTGFFGGVQRPRGDRLADFVLGTFTRSEQSALPEVLERVTAAVSLIVDKGATEAMNRSNA